MNVIGPGDGELIGDSADRRVEILAELDAVHVTISRFAAGRDGADRHVHRLHHDVFYVADGELTLKVDGGETVVGAGWLVCVPPLVVHGFRNGSDAGMTYLNLHAPGAGFADYMRGLRDRVKVPFDQYEPPASGTRPPSDIFIGPPPHVVDGLALSVDDDGVLAIGDLLRVNPAPR